MKHCIKKFFIILITLAHAAQLGAVIPYFSIRSQAEDAARELAGWAHQVNIFGNGKMYSTYAVTAEYTQSFKNNDLAQCLFGKQSCTNNCPTAITISGSRTANRGLNDWLADYFYLPTDFKSIISFDPHIANAIADLNLYLGLDQLYSGLFFRAHLPVTWTKWSLDFCERVIDAGQNTADAGYFASAPITRNQLVTNFSQYAQGATINGVTEVVYDSLQFAKIYNCSQEKTRLADLQIVLGLNFIKIPDFHFGAGLRICAPTGNRPEGKLFFEPIVGNGKHWEVGAQFTGHAALLNFENSHQLGIYSDLNITHLFKTRQTRTFDLKNKPFSRYALAEMLALPLESELVGQNIGGAFVAPDSQFKRELTPVANLTTQEVNVSVGAQFDLAVQLTYAYKNFNWDIGYDIWGKTGEKICRDCDKKCFRSPQFYPNVWALKGDASIFGFEDSLPSVSVPLSATQSNATIYSGTNFPPSGAITPTEVSTGMQNLNVDNARLAFFDDGSTQLFTQPGGADPINSSIDPVFIEFANFDFVSNSGFSQKFYTHISYNDFDRPTYAPYIGIGAFVELGRSEGINCNNSCSSFRTCDDNCSTSSVQCSLSQWGMWLKAGLSFH